jgi:hypothetical protein
MPENYTLPVYFDTAQEKGKAGPRTTDMASQNNLNQLLQAGVPQNMIANYGARLSSGEAQGIYNTYLPTAQSNSNVPSLDELAGQQYQFDPNQYLPGIQQQASAIYDPRQAQIDALKQYTQSQAEQTRIRTQEDFAKQLKQEVESINARGAFFGGGALNRESDIRTNEQRALTDINLQETANLASLTSQAGSLNAEQAQFVQDRLYNAEASAYNRFTDMRNFLLTLNGEQRNRFESDRTYNRQVFESDRSFNEMVRQFEKNYQLDKAQLELAVDRFKEEKRQYGLNYALDSFTAKVNAQKKSSPISSVDSILDNLFGSTTNTGANILSGGYSSTTEKDGEYGDYYVSNGVRYKK